MLTEEEIKEFQRIWKEEFGEDLTYQQAHDRAIEVAAFFEVLSDLQNTAASKQKNKTRLNPRAITVARISRCTCRPEHTTGEDVNWPE
ncbi:MAG: hypothetical protein A3C85_03620 [Candidatus Doudnabacteria bacterium RIFCSPHIGHO2_02_FULL_48_21]|nr:MAG: hypothetical protein A3C85_03620 [Candidatus Doudnabacteria bacterium RIFCSPHIGHO2_02_FULL_48_21]